MTKKLRDFYFKNDQMRAFLKGVEKRDEKFIISAMVGTEFESAERVIRKGTMDRALLIVAGGTLLAFTEEGENITYEEGAILGVEQFLWNRPWPHDLICGQQATVSKLKWESLLDLVKQQAITAARLYKRVVRHYCYMRLYESGRKKRNAHLMGFSNITDEDLMIDFKLNPRVEKDGLLFSLITQARKPDQKGKREVVDTETMPYFLTSEYKAVIDHAAA